MGQYLAQSGFIKFSTWVEGIRILHEGIIKVESALISNKELPDFVSESEISVIKKRMRLRFTLLQYLYNLTGKDTFKEILHANLADKSKINHDDVLNQLLPYLDGEGWVTFATVDTVRITENGIDFVKGIQSKAEIADSPTPYVQREIPNQSTFVQRKEVGTPWEINISSINYLNVPRIMMEIASKGSRLHIPNVQLDAQRGLRGLGFNLNYYLTIMKLMGKVDRAFDVLCQW